MINGKKTAHSLAVAKGIITGVAPKLGKKDAEALQTAAEIIKAVAERIRYETERERLEANGQQDLFLKAATG